MNRLRKLRVAVLFGGRSGEHEISLMSAAAIIQQLDREKYEVIPVAITRQGRWIPAEPPSGDVLQVVGEEEGGETLLPAVTDGERGLWRLGDTGVRLEPVDVIFPVLHGPFGEDGTIQGMLELADLPYVGAGVLASAVGMDKILMKRVFREAGLPVVRFRCFLRREVETSCHRVIQEVQQHIGYPCFVKPANLGSSVGVTKVKGPEELPRALRVACEYDRKLLVEEAVEGREIECSVLGNDDPEVSVPGEVIPAREFYSYEAKYLDRDTRLVVPAPLRPETERRIREYARRAFLAIDCAGMARVDFFVSHDEKVIFVNEINTIPGFTQVSMYPRMWEASGLPFSRLLDRLIELAIERYRDTRRRSVVWRPSS